MAIGSASFGGEIILKSVGFGIKISSDNPIAIGAREEKCDFGSSLPEIEIINYSTGNYEAEEGSVPPPEIIGPLPKGAGLPPGAAAPPEGFGPPPGVTGPPPEGFGPPPGVSGPPPEGFGPPPGVMGPPPEGFGAPPEAVIEKKKASGKSTTEKKAPKAKTAKVPKEAAKEKAPEEKKKAASKAAKTVKTAKKKKSAEDKAE